MDTVTKPSVLFVARGSEKVKEAAAKILAAAKG
jgi:hypothetical protein